MPGNFEEQKLEFRTFDEIHRYFISSYNQDPLSGSAEQALEEQKRFIREHIPLIERLYTESLQIYEFSPHKILVFTPTDLLFEFSPEFVKYLLKSGLIEESIIGYFISTHEVEDWNKFDDQWIRDQYDDWAKLADVLRDLYQRYNLIAQHGLTVRDNVTWEKKCHDFLEYLGKDRLRNKFATHLASYATSCKKVYGYETFVEFLKFLDKDDSWLRNFIQAKELSIILHTIADTTYEFSSCLARWKLFLETYLASDWKNQFLHDSVWLKQLIIEWDEVNHKNTLTLFLTTYFDIDEDCLERVVPILNMLNLNLIEEKSDLTKKRIHDKCFSFIRVFDRDKCYHMLLENGFSAAICEINKYENQPFYYLLLYMLTIGYTSTLYKKTDTFFGCHYTPENIKCLLDSIRDKKPLPESFEKLSGELGIIGYLYSESLKPILTHDRKLKPRVIKAEDISIINEKKGLTF